MEPFKEGVVKAEFDVRLSRLDGRLELADDVPLRPDVHRVPAERVARRPIREPVVMLARKDQVPDADQNMFIYQWPTYKASTNVNYDSRVVITSKLFIFTTLDP